eukprot:5516690-Pyramimonas_sp.AAC.1
MPPRKGPSCVHGALAWPAWWSCPRTPAARTWGLSNNPTTDFTSDSSEVGIAGAKLRVVRSQAVG